MPAPTNASAFRTHALAAATALWCGAARMTPSATARLALKRLRVTCDCQGSIMIKKLVSTITSTGITTQNPEVSATRPGRRWPEPLHLRGRQSGQCHRPRRLMCLTHDRRRRGHLGWLRSDWSCDFRPCWLGELSIGADVIGGLTMLNGADNLIAGGRSAISGEYTRSFGEAVIHRYVQNDLAADLLYTTINSSLAMPEYRLNVHLKLKKAFTNLLKVYNMETTDYFILGYNNNEHHSLFKRLHKLLV